MKGFLGLGFDCLEFHYVNIEPYNGMTLMSTLGLGDDPRIDPYCAMGEMESSLFLHMG